jgi:ornithine carbamoyltransferase
VFRTSAHERIRNLAEHATVPILNGLCDLHHPLQILADLQTVQESLGDALDGLRVAWVGDGNNVAHSWIEAASIIGFELVLACPPGYQPNAEIVAAAQNGRGQVRIVESVEEACRGADVVTTDVWVSMGQEGEASARNDVFADYTVDAQRMAIAKERAIFLHCLPAHRGEEVAAEVIDGPWSRVWDEAENRLHSQKALLELLL